jgi:armadillo repeat-containing protein 8
LLAGGILPPLLETLSPSEVSSKLIVATLRTLILIVDATALDKPWMETANGPLRPSVTASIPDQLYTRPVVDGLADILAQTSPSPTVHQQISLTAQLISRTCREDQQQRMLLNAGILELLATKLAGIATSGDSSLRAIGADPRTSSRDVLPSIYLADILEAIGAIVQNSNYRTAQFLYSPAILNVFPVMKSNAGYEGVMSSLDSYSASQGTPQAASFDRLLPRLQAVQSKTESSFSRAFPALGSFTATGEFARVLSYSDLQSQPASRIISGDEFESPIFTWLIHVARRGQGHDRLTATWVLSLLKKFSEAYPSDESLKNRERALAFLIVPLIVKMIEEAGPSPDQKPKSRVSNPQEATDSRRILERAPAVLAALIDQSSALQKAAVEAKAITKLCQILKRSFDPASSSSKPLWSPRPPSPTLQDPTIDPASSTLGRSGLSPEISHVLKVREGALKALAAIADKEDQYRKIIIENGAVACITDSLLSYPENPAEESSREASGAQNGVSTIAKDGNPVPVLIAACHAARSMSRSVSVLRTSLIDYGVAKPILALLKHPDMNVQIAATEVLCNLVLHFSPMRDVSSTLGPVLFLNAMLTDSYRISLRLTR